MNSLQFSQDRLEHLRHLEAHPRDSFLFLGPTGVGKTELALALVLAGVSVLLAYAERIFSF